LPTFHNDLRYRNCIRLKGEKNTLVVADDPRHVIFSGVKWSARVQQDKQTILSCVFRDWSLGVARQ